MDDGVSHDPGTAHRAELDALRARAYSASADISDDPAALARLAELEDLARRARSDAASTAPASVAASARVATWAPNHTPAHTPALAAAPASPVPRGLRGHPRLIGVTVAAALLLGAGAAATSTSPNTMKTSDAGGSVTSTSVPAAFDLDAAGVVSDDERRGWSASKEAYEANLAQLRDDALGGSNAQYEHALRRLDVDALVPKGTIDGRSVWVGPTIDGVTCMVLGGQDGPYIGCAIPASVAERGLIVTAPPARDIAAGGPTRVRFTLAADGSVTSEALTAGSRVESRLSAKPYTSTSDLYLDVLALPGAEPDGSVVTVPADAASAPPALPGAPTPTATPPPGWQ